jgi:hypothetical protein
MQKPTQHPHVRRIESRRTWHVRVWHADSRRFPGNCYFGDTVYGSKKASLEAACRFREKLIAKYKIVSPSERNGAYARHSRNKSGVVGVMLERNHNGEPMTWKAYLGRNHHKRFRVGKYGYAGAFKLAVLERYRMMGVPSPERIAAPPRRRTGLAATAAST